MTQGGESNPCHVKKEEHLRERPLSLRLEAMAVPKMGLLTLIMGFFEIKDPIYMYEYILIYVYVHTRACVCSGVFYRP